MEVQPSGFLSGYWNDKVNNTDWNSLQSEDINLKWHCRFLEIVHACIPRVTTKSKKTLPWINRHILQLIWVRQIILMFWPILL